jgi:hypothetical protein
MEFLNGIFSRGFGQKLGSLNPGQRRRAYGVMCTLYSISAPTLYTVHRRRAYVVTEHLRYTYAVQLKSRRAYAVTELVLRSNV